MVTTTSSTSPLKDNWEGRVGLGYVDHRLDRLDGARLESDVLETKGLDVLLSDLDGRDTSTDGQTLNRDTLGSQSPNQRNLPRHCSGVDVNQVDRDTPTSRNSLLDLRESLRHGPGIVVSTSSQLDVVTGVHRSG